MSGQPGGGVDSPGLPTVLFVHLARGLGGSARSLGQAIAHMEGQVHRVLASPAGGKFSDLVDAEGLAEERVALPWSPVGSSRLADRLIASIRLTRWARRNRGRLTTILVNGPEELNVTLPAVLASDARLVMWSHAWGVPPWTPRLAPLWRRLLRGRDVRWTAVSELACEMLVRGGLADAGETHVLPNPVDPSRIRARERRAHPDVTVGFLGSPDRRKGIHLLPDVMARVSDTGARWLLFTAGRGAEFEAAWKEISDLDVPVEHRGVVVDVRDAYAEIDVVFVPSYAESFCRVAVEAMVNGLPVVASDLRPVREIVGDGEGGLLFPAGDTEAAAARLRRLIGSSTLRAELGRTGQSRAAAFDPPLIAARLLRECGIAPSSAAGGA